MILFIYQPTASVYWFEEAHMPLNEKDELGTLMFAPMAKIGTVDLDDGHEVDEDLVGDEEIGKGEFKTFHELYEYLRSLRQEREL